MLMPILSPLQRILTKYLDRNSKRKFKNANNNSLTQDLFKRQCLTSSKLIDDNRESRATRKTHLLTVYRL